MEKILLDTYTERLLLKRTRDLIKFVPYDVFVHIEQIVNEAVNNHYVFRHKLEELLALLQELESHKECVENKTEQRASEFKKSCKTSQTRNDSIVSYNQMYFFEVNKYKRMVIMMLTGKVNVDDKSKNNGVAF